MRISLLVSICMLACSIQSLAQDKPTDKSVVIASFKAKASETITKENLAAGQEHAKSRTLHIPAADLVWVVKKDGSPCQDKSHRHCQEVLRDRDDYWREYYDPVSLKDCEINVRATDSLTSPYHGILSYHRHDYRTAVHTTKIEAEQDSKFHQVGGEHPVHVVIEFDYRDGSWVQTMESCMGGTHMYSVSCDSTYVFDDL